MSALSLPVYTRRKYNSVLSDTQRSVDAQGIVVRKLATYLTIPEFSLDATWRGASEIIKKFRFNLSSPISFVRITPPSDPNFVACVAWKPTSETIIRYKLWEDVGEILYVPLYGGQTVLANFSIEIWNTKPDSISGGTLTTEDDIILTTEDGLELETEGSIIGAVETLLSQGTAIIHTSKMILPTSYCQAYAESLGVPDDCHDIIFDFGIYGGDKSDEFIPFDGDYFTVDNDCGDITLHKGPVLTGTELVLQSTDGTWHKVYAMRYLGNTHLVVDQNDELPSLTPYIYMQYLVGINYKIDLMKIGESHHLRINPTPSASLLNYASLYLEAAEDGLSYGCRLVSSLDNIVFQVSQDGL